MPGFHCRWAWLPLLLGMAAAGFSQERGEESSGDKAAVRRAAEQFIAALHRGDAETLVAMWTAEGDFVDSTGTVTKGRELARQAGKKSSPDATSSSKNQTITVDSIRFLTPEVALEDGTTDFPGEDGSLTVARYTAIWVKREGKWLLDSVRESAPYEAAHRDRLRSLGWLVGNWVQQGGEGKVEIACRPSQDGNYLLREIKVETPEGKTSSVSQRIGWDAAKKQITAWTFDSDGGHGVGTWSREEGHWVVRSVGVLPDGQTVSSTNTYTRDGADAFTWESRHEAEDGSPAMHRKIEFARRKSTDKSSGNGH